MAHGVDCTLKAKPVTLNLRKWSQFKPGLDSWHVLNLKLFSIDHRDTVKQTQFHFKAVLKALFLFSLDLEFVQRGVQILDFHSENILSI